MKHHTFFKAITAFSAVILCVQPFFPVFVPTARAEDRGTDNWRNQSTQQYPSNLLVNISAVDQQTGAATASIPLVVPPGRLGIEPKLALTYNSQDRNTAFGVGWNLDLGKITRSTKKGLPSFTANDVFVSTFMGNGELAKVGASEWREKIERNFTKYTYAGDTWTVKDKSGTTYAFGSAAASRMAGSGGTFGWYLDRVEDVHGNYLTIAYTLDQNTPYPQTIAYTGNSQTQKAPAATVTFVYDAKSKQLASYASGVKTVDTKRTKEIQMTVSGQLVRKYMLEYGTLPEFDFTPYEILKKVTSFGSDGTSALPAIVMTYTQTSPNFQTSTPWTNGLPSGIDFSTDKGWRWGDLNGDNLPDLVQLYAEYLNDVQQTLSRKVFLNTGSGWAESSSWELPLPNILFVKKENYNGVVWINDNGTRLVDLNNDGLADFVYMITLFNRKPTACGASGWQPYGQVYLNTGSGWQDNGPWTATLPTDLFGSSDPRSTTYPGFINKYIDYDVSCMVARMHDEDTGVRLTDINGDGLTDWVQYSTMNGVSARTVRLNSGSGFGPDNAAWRDNLPEAFVFRGAWGTAGYQEQRKVEDRGARLADVNADGLVDVVRSHDYRQVNDGSCSYPSPTTVREVLYNTGSGAFSGNDTALANTMAEPFVDDFMTWKNYPNDPWFHYNLDTGQRLMDMNGDGFSDLVYSGTKWDLSNKFISTFNGSYWTGSATWLYALPDPTILTRTRQCTSNGNAYSLQNNGVELQDVNGDGVPDFIQATPTAKKVMINNGIQPKNTLLASIDNGLGSKIEFTYKPTTQVGMLGPIMDVVATRKETDRGNALTYTYDYANGLYSYTNREFRGFGNVTMTYPDTGKIENQYLQDDIYKGLVKQMTVTSSAGKTLSQTVNTYMNRSDFAGASVFPYLTQQDASAYDSSGANPQTKRTTFEYDAYGNVTKQSELGDTAITGDERTTTYSYMPNTATWIVGKPYSTQTNDAAGNAISRTNYFYDGIPSPIPPTKGDLTRVERWLSSGSSPSTWYEYDAYGNQTAVIDAKGNRTTTAYEATYKQYPQTVTNALGHVEQYAYDPKFGVVMSVTDANGQITTNTYDVFGRPSTVVRPGDTALLPTVVYTYNLASQPISLKQENRIDDTHMFSTVTFYDGFGRQIEVKKMSEGNDSIVSQQTVFDERGNTARSWLPRYGSGPLTSYVAPDTAKPNIVYAYDAANRLTKTTYPDATTETVSYDRWNMTTTDRNGHQKTQQNDAYGRATAVLEKNGASTYITSYTYDSLNNLLTVKDQNNNTTTLVYDTLGRKTSMTDPDMGTWQYAYDANGNLTWQNDGKLQQTAFSYDALNRVFLKYYPNRPYGPTIPYLYTYDDPNVSNSRGRLTAVEYWPPEVGASSMKTSFTYDQRGRKSGETRVIDSTSYALSWTYDSMDRMTGLKYPDDEIVMYAYNGQGLIDRVTGASVYANNADYNAADQPTSLVYGNGAVANYAYNANTQRPDHFQTMSNTQLVQYLAYAYDGVGNVTGITDTKHTATQTFGYDDMNRLTGANGSYGAKTYSYNALGNIITKEGVTYAYGSSKPHAVTNTSAGYTANYDANGNTVATRGTALIYDFDNRLTEFRKTDGSVTDTFMYDWQGNRVKKVAKITGPDPACGGTTAATTVSPTTLSETTSSVPTSSTKKASSSAVTTASTSTTRTAGMQKAAVSGSVSMLSSTSRYVPRKIDDGDNPGGGCPTVTTTTPTHYIGNVYEKEGSTVRKHYFIGSQKVATRTNGTLAYFHNDHLGSTNVATNASGALVGVTEYTPFGSTTNDTNTGTDYKYTGKELDTETGLYYYGSRYYDPNLGRFVSADSLVPSWYDPQSLNRYSYVLDNPMRYTDSTGHDPFVDEKAQSYEFWKFTSNLVGNTCADYCHYIPVVPFVPSYVGKVFQYRRQGMSASEASSKALDYYTQHMDEVAFDVLLWKVGDYISTGLQEGTYAKDYFNSEGVKTTTRLFGKTNAGLGYSIKIPGGQYMPVTAEFAKKWLLKAADAILGDQAQEGLIKTYRQTTVDFSKFMDKANARPEWYSSPVNTGSSGSGLCSDDSGSVTQPTLSAAHPC